MKFYIVTFGCKVNQYESEAMSYALCSEGFSRVDRLEDADIVLLNSCTVTESSDQKLKRAIRNIRRNMPYVTIVLTGCMPQAFPELTDNFSDVDIILGNSNRLQLASYIRQFLNIGSRIVAIDAYHSRASFENIQLNSFYGRTRAFLKIQDGCDRFCSYCIIPYARGPIRSRPLGDIKQETIRLVESGYQEIVLVGINLFSYGRDLGCTLLDAVHVVEMVNGVKRIRLGSLEPDAIGENEVREFSLQEKLCPQFHLSLQSGSNSTLQRMNRRYSAEQYQRVVELFRSYFLNPSITTDIMVGFPGETEQEFLESKRFVEQIGFSRAHVFSYSKRKGTKAFAMQGQVSDPVKKVRNQQMRDVVWKSQTNFLKQQAGQTENVLFESKVEEGYQEGYTENYTLVKVKSELDLCGEIHRVQLLEMRENYYLGRCMDAVRE